MIDKPVLPRALAMQDAQDAIDYYLSEAGLEVALRFVASLEVARTLISSAPGAGSLRYSQVVGFPGLRSRKLARFPYILFYIERDDHIDLWRVLHARRDIPAALQEQ